MKALYFNGSGFEYFKIWIVNILLTIVTIGIYYPWAKVRNKRYLYANTYLEDRHFEYHATGKQLLLGHLIAMALLIAYIVTEHLFPAGAGIVIIIFFFIFPWVIWRSLMFNMHMTSFSHVRFSFAGSVGNAYVNYMLLPALFFIALYGPMVASAIAIHFFGNEGAMSSSTGGAIMLGVVFGLCLAFYFFALMKKRNACYAIGNYRYGQGVFSIDVETRGFAKILAKTIGLSFLVMLGTIFLMGIVIATVGYDEIWAMSGTMNDPELMQEAMFNEYAIAFIGVIYFILIVASFIIAAYTKARQRLYIFSNTTLDNDITFASTLKARSLAWVMISNLFLIILTLGLAFPWAKVRMIRLTLENTQVDSEQGFEHYISQQQQSQSAIGEQIGDTFDVDFGVGI